jgi:hypothetical protein
VIAGGDEVPEAPMTSGASKEEDVELDDDVDVDGG